MYNNFTNIIILEAFSLPFKYKSILKSLIIYDIKSKYAGSFLGYLWIILYPLLFLSVYAIVYLFIFKVKLQMLTSYEYILLIFSGLIPFLSFAEAINRGVHSIVSNANLVKNTLFPIETIALQIVLSSQIIQIVGFMVLLIILTFINKIYTTLILLPFVWFLQIMFTVGIVWIISAVNVFFKDLGNVINLLTIILMLISPIAYTEDMLSENLRKLLLLNPLYYLMVLYHKIFIFGKFDFIFLIKFSILSVFTYIIGFYIFYKLKEAFSDYV